MEQFLTVKKYPYFIAGILVFLGLYLTSLYHYLLFHSLAEIFSITIACGIFMIAWNSRQFIDNNYLLFIGIAYLFVAGVDLIHALAYKGMGVFEGYETNLATQLWIATRYMVSLSLLIAPLLFRRKLKTNLIFFGYIVVTSISLLSIFYWNIFPVCFIEGMGLTPFEKISEYIITLIFLASIVLLFKNRGEFARNVFQWIVWSIIMAIACELAFTFYIHAYGFSNMVGHFFEILSFYFIYKAIIETGLTKPHDLLFRNLKQTEVLLREEKNKIQGYLDIAGVVLVAIDSDQKVTLINKKGGETLGYDETEIIGKNWFDTFIPERDRGEVKTGFKKLMDGEVEPIEYFENPILTRSGEERIMAWHNSVLRDKKNNIISILSSGEDITERKKMEKSLAQLASYPELNPNPVVEVDLTGYVSYFNSAAKQLFPDLPSMEIIHPWLEGFESLAMMLQKDPQTFHTREMKIGDVWYEQTIHCVSEGKRLRIYGLDITERKEAEGALKNALEGSKQRGAEISALLEGSRAVLEYHEFKDSAQSIFDSCKNLIGATAGYIALLSKDGAENEVLFLDSGGLSCTVDPSLPMPIRGLREEAYRTGKTVFHNDFSKSEYVKFMPKGHADLHNVLFAPLVIKEKVTGLIGLANKTNGFTENDARMASAFGEFAAVALQNSRTLEALENSEERYRTVAQTANDAIISVDGHGHIIFWNNSAELTFGYSFDEVVGRPLTFIMPERFCESHQEAMSRVISTGKSNIVGKTVEMVGLRKDGHEFPIELSLANWKIREEIFFTGIIRDITQRKQAGDVLRQKTHELGERVKELNSLYAFSKLIEKPDIRLPEIFQGLVDIIPSGWQYPEMTCARLVLEDQIFKTANFMETIWKQSSPILVDGRHIGDLEVYYLEGKPEFEEGPFLKDERNLIDALAGRLGKTIKRIWAEEALQKAHDELEQRVKERTAQLMRANEQLNQEMEEHKQVEEEKVRQHRRLEALWKITRNIDADYKTLYDMVLVEIIEMTQSRYGFYGFINEDESVMTIHSWSKEAMESCKISDKPIEFPIVKAGLWGEAVRKRKISIVNDYKGDHPGKKGIPEGHVSLTRVLTVPVFSHGRIIALATISDKPTDYTEEDAEQINAFMTHLQVILERRQAEEALRESENRLRSLSSQLLTVQENERKRIAMELHDGIGQLLTAIKFKVENVLQEKGKARANEKSLEAIIPMVKESVEEIRRIQMDLRPSVLDDLGILATIGWFTREFQKVYSHISIEKEIHLLEDQVPDPLKIVLFRVIQEAMNNIAKYSKADLVHLSLQKTDGTIELAIQDNGQGFNLMEVLSVEGSKRGLGLTSMRERTELSGGSFVVESTRGRGTVIRALWPTG